MNSNVITPRTSRQVTSALFAAVLLVCAAVIAPLCALIVACAMPCCEGKFVQWTAAAGCAEHCGIRSNTPSQELPKAVAPSGIAKIAFASLAVAETSNITARTPPPRLPAFSVGSHHAVPGDAPVYLYNSVFLI
jgi:hypothetical protein